MAEPEDEEEVDQEAMAAEWAAAAGGDDEDEEVDQEAMAAEWAAAAGGDDDEDGEVDQEAMAAEWEAAAAGGGDGESGDGQSAPDEESLAAQWAGIMEADDLSRVKQASGEAEETPTSRELNQNEIDNLLGFNDSAVKSEKSGILAIVNSNDISYERLPMLEVVFDRLERMLTTSIRNFTAENVDINLEAVAAQRFGDYLNSVPLPAMISVFHAVEWDNYGLITVDSPMIYSIVDVLLGGRRGTVPMRVEGRPYTTIEASLVERLTRLILHDLSLAFAPITQVQFRFDRMETNPRFAAIARPGNACVVFKLRIDMQDRGGEIEFLIPYATLEPARDLLLQGFMGEKFGRDSIWETHLAREILVTDIELEAVLDEHVVSLQDITRLKVGSILPLNASTTAQIILRCGQVPMLKGRIGRIGDNLAIEIEEKVPREKGTARA